MKFNKLFMLAVAGLAMTACSSDEEMGNNLSGNGVVEVKIAAPQLRALVDATEGKNNDKVNVDGPIYVKLTYRDAEGNEYYKEEKIEDINGGNHTVKFFGVTNPQKIEAWANDGNTKGLGTTQVQEMQVLPAKVPAYGVSKSITLAGKTEMSDGKTYEMYKASVTMKIPVARLEISGIKHVHQEPDKGCKYSALTINGIYLDKVSTTKGNAPVDYSMPAVMGDDGQTVVVPAPILMDEIAAPVETNFLTPDAVWPALVPGEGANQQAYAFNFYPNAKNQMPIVKIYFANATATDVTNPVSQPRYAVIKSYNGKKDFEFEAGKIYRITEVNLDDKNIIGDEEGNTLYGVDVTVTEAQWTIFDTIGEWEEQ